MGERIEGNLICDVEPTNWTIDRNIHKINNMQYLCKNKKKIIEIGVNACHSLLLMLLVNPNAEYVLFDLNSHAYTEPCIHYIKSQFPDTKIDVIYGNSVETIHKYIMDNPHELNTFDLIHIDGGHSPDIFMNDYNHCKKLSNGIFDDYDMYEINKFINIMIFTNQITQYKDSNMTENDLHFIYIVNI